MHVSPQNDDTGLYSHLTGVPKALLPGIGGKKILDFWWETVNMCVPPPPRPISFSLLKTNVVLSDCVLRPSRRQVFTEVFLVTNADK